MHVKAEEAQSRLFATEDNGEKWVLPPYDPANPRMINVGVSYMTCCGAVSEDNRAAGVPFVAYTWTAGTLECYRCGVMMCSVGAWLSDDSHVCLDCLRCAMVTAASTVNSTIKACSVASTVQTNVYVRRFFDRNTRTATWDAAMATIAQTPITLPNRTLTGRAVFGRNFNFTLAQLFAAAVAKDEAALDAILNYRCFRTNVDNFLYSAVNYIRNC